MKKFVFLLLVIFSFSMWNVYAQAPMQVMDAVAETILEATFAENIIYYVQTVANQVESIAHFVTMIETLGIQAERTVQNLASAKDINSFKDFMDWYNRSLYMERQTLDMLNNTNITIGKKSYNFMDVEGIAYGAKDTYIDYWDKEFTNEQRREMWLGLGLTPANYAYVEPFRDDMREWRRTSPLTVSAISAILAVKYFTGGIWRTFRGRQKSGCYSLCACWRIISRREIPAR